MANFVGIQSSAAGTSPFDATRVDGSGAQVVTQAHGKYYEATARGRMYYGATAATGIALIVPATTGNHPTLWNPSDSGRNLSIARLELSWVSGNNAPGAIEWALTSDTGSSVATGAPIATFTQVAPVPCLVGGGSDPVGRWAPAVNTYTAAPVMTRPTGLSLFTGISTTAVAPFILRMDYDGDLVLSPGTALSLCTQAATTTAVFQVAVVWEEIDV